ncbi:hypothetical protein TSAR_012597 [Trichomalopsis sarcophagae]|uniref:Uncharacterized protein n=1 Tax=Trichomalopsis sarcophagae TaxID=543379 RepID=A0A232EJN2_9HYME|nr:hypothetical protein TSAR_012597 [Trichomalopsis sarcophagae]
MSYMPIRDRLTGLPMNVALPLLDGLVALNFTSSAPLSGQRPTEFLLVALVRAALGCFNLSTMS